VGSLSAHLSFYPDNPRGQTSCPPYDWLRCPGLSGYPAKLLQVSTETVRRLVRAGELRGFKVGAEWRFTQDDLQQFIEQQRPTRHAETTL